MTKIEDMLQSVIHYLRLADHKLGEWPVFEEDFAETLVKGVQFLILLNLFEKVFDCIQSRDSWESNTQNQENMTHWA